jgi:hypothetical protein
MPKAGVARRHTTEYYRATNIDGQVAVRNLFSFLTRLNSLDDLPLYVSVGPKYIWLQAGDFTFFLPPTAISDPFLMDCKDERHLFTELIVAAIRTTIDKQGVWPIMKVTVAKIVCWLCVNLMCYGLVGFWEANFKANIPIEDWLIGWHPVLLSAMVLTNLTVWSCTVLTKAHR